MSSADITPRRHRQSRDAAVLSTASSQDAQNPHNLQHLNMQAHTRNLQAGYEMEQPPQSAQPTTPPRTPRGNDGPAPQNIPNSAAPATTGSKQKRNKNRQKHMTTSPAAARSDRTTPPGALYGGVSSSARAIHTPAAYAGPTFHASPAPSALPIPSFYSKSVPDSLKVKAPNAGKDKNSSVTHLATPPAVSASYSQREESPLDLFFKADRAEKARAQSASSNKAAGGATGPFRPPSDGQTRNGQTPQASSNERLARGASSNRLSSGGMFAMEMDGEKGPGTPLGPAFSTPYAERIHAARSANQYAKPQNQSPRDAQQSLDRSEALKAYLFSGHQSQSPIASNPTDGPALPAAASSAGVYQQSPMSHSSHTNTGPFQRIQQSGCESSPDQKGPTSAQRPSGRSSGLRQEVNPTNTPTRTPDRRSYANSPTPSRVYTSNNCNDYMDFPTSHNGVPNQGRTADIQNMEDSLRKILKLDSVGISGANGIGRLPTASASVPNYVGGRPPPENGMHNGVMGS